MSNYPSQENFSDKQFVVFYELLYSIDHLNHEWESTYEIFDSIEKANSFILDNSNKYQYSNILGPLKLA